MLSLRRRKKDTLSPQAPVENVSLSPMLVYRKLVAKSSTLFRSDIEFVEKPRQVVFGSILVIILYYLSDLSSSLDEDIITSARYALWSLLGVTVVYSMLQSKDGLMVCGCVF